MIIMMLYCSIQLQGQNFGVDFDLLDSSGVWPRLDSRPIFVLSIEAKDSHRTKVKTKILAWKLRPKL